MSNHGILITDETGLWEKVFHLMDRDFLNASSGGKELGKTFHQSNSEEEEVAFYEIKRLIGLAFELIFIRLAT
jgi:hypothetical protein